VRERGRRLGDLGPATVAAQIALITAYKQAQGRAVYNGAWEDPVNMSLFDSRAGTWLTAIIDALLPP
jgi:hypothetical protein